jgi:UDP-N-acetylglucosamine acyltransferase
MDNDSIHPTAIVSGEAHIEPGVEIGPYAVIEDQVRIGAGTRIGAHAVIRRFSSIGRDNFIDAHAVIGGNPQHTKFDESDTGVEVGDNNVIREGVTIHRAFVPGKKTRVGSNCFLMAYSHVGHDCLVADNVTLTNNVVLGGHVEIGDSAIMGGCSGAHQFVRIGALSMVAGFVPLRKDVLPFTLVGGDPVRHYRLNTIGLRRNGVDKERYRTLEAAFRALRKGDKNFAELPQTEDLACLRKWLSVKSKYGCYGFVDNKGK